jgi:hypothetical protein
MKNVDPRFSQTEYREPLIRINKTYPAIAAGKMRRFIFASTGCRENVRRPGKPRPMPHAHQSCRGEAVQHPIRMPYADVASQYPSITAPVT